MPIRSETKRFVAGGLEEEEDPVLEEWLEETQMQPEVEVSSERYVYNGCVCLWWIV